MTKKPRIYLYDSTLRDGAQTGTVNFSVRDKLEIAKVIDESLLEEMIEFAEKNLKRSNLYFQLF